MKTAIIALAVLFQLALTSPVEETETVRLLRSLEENRGSAEYQAGFRDALEIQRRFDIGGVVNSIKNWIVQHGMQITSASCALACEAATFVETLGVSTPVCVGLCGLVGAFGK